MARKTIIKSGHFYLVPQPDAEPVMVEGTTYQIFKVLDMKKKPVSSYDFLHIRGSVRIDLEENMFRIYPDLGDLNLVYDLDKHTIMSEDVADGEEKD